MTVVRNAKTACPNDAAFARMPARGKLHSRQLAGVYWQFSPSRRYALRLRREINSKKDRERAEPFVCFFASASSVHLDSGALIFLRKYGRFRAVDAILRPRRDSVDGECTRQIRVACRWCCDFRISSRERRGSEESSAALLLAILCVDKIEKPGGIIPLHSHS